MDDKTEWNDEQDWGDDEIVSNGGGQSFSFSGDSYSVTASHKKDKYDNDQLTTEIKFDKYFMYGIDNMGGNSDDMPPCGPGAKMDACQKTVNS